MLGNGHECSSIPLVDEFFTDVFFPGPAWRTEYDVQNGRYIGDFAAELQNRAPLYRVPMSDPECRFPKYGFPRMQSQNVWVNPMQKSETEHRDKNLVQ